MIKKTKIVCTIGPASESKEVLKNLMLNGMNVARLNFSHGTHEEHQVRIDTIKEVREMLALPIAIMLDTKGPEIRLGQFGVESVELKIGDIFTLTPKDIQGDQSIVSISYKELYKDVHVGGTILIDDGLVELTIREITEDGDLICRVENNGILKSKKGVNVPNMRISLPAVTEKDKSDLRFGVKNGIDYVAASFVRKAQDVIDIRRVLEESGGANVRIIAKIENCEGVENVEEILQVADGIMVARGDLGVEIPAEEIPLIQKKIVSTCNQLGKPVIIATQMLDSMQRNPRPTRAEVTDVANAILDGTDAIMLSGETAAGKYPINAVETMYKIALNIESSDSFKEVVLDRVHWREANTSNAISQSTCTLADELGASAIVSPTTSGITAMAISKYRPAVPIVAATYTEDVRRKLALIWGVESVLCEQTEATDEVLEKSINAAFNAELISEGDLIIITAGIPAGIAGTTNMIKVHTVGNVLVRGLGIGKKSVSAKTCVGSSREELEGRFEEGMILVSKTTEVDMIEYIKKASALVVEEGGLTSHAAIVGLSLELPTIIGAADATLKIKDNETITVDAASGLVYSGCVKAL